MKIKSDGDAGAALLAVEVISPFNLLNDYAKYDATGQQLIDGSYVLINGERVSLNLQAAEVSAGEPRR